MNRIIISTAMLIGTMLAGCSSLDGNWKKHLPWSAEKRIKESKAEGPATLVSIWTPDILTQTGKPPTRGFGGRLYFYNAKSQAIPVEGQLVVFAYDDSEAKHTNADPERKYAFTPEQFERHYSKSDLGPSYSVWIPWDVVGGEQKSISLVPVFTASNGQLVMGQQAINVLPGKPIAKVEAMNPEFEISRMPPTSVQPVAHFAAPNTSAMPTDPGIANASLGGLKTSTIQIPKSLQSRLMQSQSIPTTDARAPGPWPPMEGNWGAIRTNTEIIREPAPQQLMGQPSSASESPSASPAAPSALPSAAPPSTSPASRSQNQLLNRSAQTIHPARSWRGGLTSPSGGPSPPFHAGPLSAPQPAF